MVFFLLKDKETFVNTCKQMILGLIMCWFTFIFWQNQITFRPENLAVTDIWTWMISVIYKSGKTVCACPSLHCYISGVLCCSWLKYKNFKMPKIAKTAFVILTILIWISTVFIKQHSIIDAVGALIVMILSYIVVYLIK